MKTSRFRRPALAAAAAVALLLAVGGGVAWAQALSRQSTDVLLDLAEAGEASLDASEAEMAEAVAESRGLSDQTAAATRLVNRVAASSASTLADILVVQHDLDAMQLDEGSELDAARDAYLAHLDAWGVQLRSLDQLVPGHVEDIDFNNAEINATWTITEREFEKLDLTAGQRERVEAILTVE
ncbi:hypothetical protein [Cellulosimicrobium sp. Marseille-Q4280]|uniref:hypothetical protein n=1 Tax=Cellulosimicrobium sp. Marseille-Q4280 TaxID=2937992 RepID=UPI002040D6DF|nr:hypothetical protein [Cellulosimicrobium sp. Marseille-Q4280]